MTAFNETIWIKIVERAINDYLYGCRSSDSQSKGVLGEYQSAFNWLFLDSQDSEILFSDICRGFGANIEELRILIKRAGDGVGGRVMRAIEVKRLISHCIKCDDTPSRGVLLDLEEDSLFLVEE